MNRGDANRYGAMELDIRPHSHMSTGTFHLRRRPNELKFGPRPLWSQASRVLLVIALTASVFLAGCANSSSDNVSYMGRWRKTIDRFYRQSDSLPPQQRRFFKRASSKQEREQLMLRITRSNLKALTLIRDQFAATRHPKQFDRLHQMTLELMDKMMSDDLSYTEALVKGVRGAQLDSMGESQSSQEQILGRNVESEAERFREYLPDCVLGK